MSTKKVTVSKPGAGGQPPVRASRTRKPALPDHPWFLEGTVVHVDGQVTIERSEQNSRQGRRIMDGWAQRRLINPDVDYIKVEPVHTLTRERSAGYLNRYERPIEVIGLKGGQS